MFLEFFRKSKSTPQVKLRCKRGLKYPNASIENSSKYDEFIKVCFEKIEGVDYVNSAMDILLKGTEKKKGYNSFKEHPKLIIGRGGFHIWFHYFTWRGEVSKESLACFRFEDGANNPD